MEIVINGCYGGFCLSREAVIRARELSGNSRWGGPTIRGDVYNGGLICKMDCGFISNIDRNDPILVAVVKELGEKANGEFAKLKVVEIPDDVIWEIHGYDGKEWIAEKHKTWS